jgi:MFS transporter, OFA family, oxalate/formate antiporter
MRAPTSVFHGWIVVVAAFVVTFVGFGSAYTFSAFLPALQTEFGASRGSVSLVFSLAGFLYFGLGVITGPLADQSGARRLVLLGMVLLGLGLVLASSAPSLAAVYAAYGLGVGIGVGCAYVPAVGAVQRWFVRRRGLASGLAVSGIGLGTLVMPPLASLLIDALGWRGAYLVLGLGVLVLGAAASCLIENDPAARGLNPDGGALSDSRDAVNVPAGASIKEAVRSRAFIGLYAGCLVCAFGVFVPFVHLVPYALDRQIAPAFATALLGLVGAGSTVGRFFLGSIADRIGRQMFLFTTYVGMAAAMAIWALATNFATLCAFTLLFGLFYGGWVAVLPAVVMDRFGSANVSGIIGILYTSVAVGTLVGPTAAGFLFDASGSYTIPIISSAVANAVAAAITAGVVTSGDGARAF